MLDYNYPPDKLKVLLLEGISSAATERFASAGMEVDERPDAMDEYELAGIIERYHVLGIRSKTQVGSGVLERAKNLMAIGCFCIGTDQVDTVTACVRGIPVFNAPFSNTRSVAELVIGEIIMLARQASWKSHQMHQGVWSKSARGCYEVKDKSLGIIGYGHIGQQVGILAEALGMKVFFYNTVPRLALGSSTKVRSIPELLSRSDFVSVHVPETPSTKGLIGEEELRMIKAGGYLINFSRGGVVDYPALVRSLKSGHLGGAALDVFPYEPHSNSESFVSELQELPNVILTPHIGGSTEEAQFRIAHEVGESLVRYVETGSTSSAVNFPIFDKPLTDAYHRVINIHRNLPEIGKQIEDVVARQRTNFASHYLSANQEVGFFIADVPPEHSGPIKAELESYDWSLKTRLVVDESC